MKSVAPYHLLAVFTPLCILAICVGREATACAIVTALLTLRWRTR